MEKKEFIAVALNPKYEIFVVHTAILSMALGNKIYPSKRAQIAYLKVGEALIKVPSK